MGALCKPSPHLTATLFLLTLTFLRCCLCRNPVYYESVGQASKPACIRSRYHHHHRQHQPEWHSIPLPPPLPIWPEHLEQPHAHRHRPQFGGDDHPDYLSLKLDYPLGSQYHSHVEDISFEDKAHYEQFDKVDGASSLPYRSVAEEHPVFYRIHRKKVPKLKKFKKKITSKPTINKNVDIEFEPTQPNYLVNKIIVIEESESLPKSKDEMNLQIERPSVKPNNVPTQQITMPSAYQPPMPNYASHNSQVNHQLFGSNPVRTIQDIHNRLNHTLLVSHIDTNIGSQNKPSDQNRLIPEVNYGGQRYTSTIGPTLPSHLDRFATVPSRVVNVTFTLANDSSSTSHFMGSSDFFVKSNKFAFQNSWTSSTSSTTESSVAKSSETTSVRSESSNHNGTDRLISSDSIHRHWTSSTSSTSTPMPPIYFFTSQRNLMPTPSALPPRATFANKRIPEESVPLAAHKRGDAPDINKEGGLDLAQVGSIIIGFCVSMLLLAGVILMVLHKETVTQRVRALAESIESRYPGLRRGEASGGDSTEPASQSMRGQSGPPPRSPPPPPPPPPPPLPKINQDLIEQIIGRPENTFSNKKCRHYFSRVHRWVPKRPPLPSDLIDKEQVR